MNVPFVDLSAQHDPIKAELTQAVNGVIERGDFVLGEEVEKFEGEFASYCGVEYGIGVDSGLSALELILRAMGIGPGDEVIVPVMTFMATAAAVSFTGAEPVFVDVDPLTYCIDVHQVEAAITPRTRAVIAVHLYGYPAEVDRLMRLAEANGMTLIEDAAQAHGARFRGRRVGSLGHAAAFSFYPSKNLGGLGDGGMVVTNDARITDKVRAMRNCGQVHRNRHEYAPFNHRLDTIQAAALRVKLRHLDEWNASRRELARQYDSLLDQSEVIPPSTKLGSHHVYHLYVVRSPRRDTLRTWLNRRGIGTGVHYPTPIHLQPFYESKGHRPGDFPIAERICREILSLPIYPNMPLLHTHVVASEVNRFQSTAFRVGGLSLAAGT